MIRIPCDVIFMQYCSSTSYLEGDGGKNALSTLHTDITTNRCYRGHKPASLSLACHY